MNLRGREMDGNFVSADRFMRALSNGEFEP